MKIIKHKEAKYSHHLCQTLVSITEEDEQVHAIDIWGNDIISFDTVTFKSSFIFWNKKEINTELDTINFDEEHVTFTIYSDRGMEVAQLFEEQDPLKREIKVYDFRV